MSMSNYPQNFVNGVTIDNMPLLQAYPGEVFYVSNADVLRMRGNSVPGTDQEGEGTFTRPFRTLDFAVSNALLTASRGDVIILFPGHEETISDATSILLDQAGIAVVGMGRGTLMPKIIMDTAASVTIPVSAANISIKNVKFSANFADIAEPFTVTAVNFLCEDCVFTQEATNMNFVEIVDTDTTDNGVDGLSFLNCEWIEPDAATTSLVNVDADIDRLRIHDCHIDLGVNGVLSALAEVAAGKDLTNVDIRRNYVSRLVTASAVQLLTFVDTTTTNTGIMEDNRCRTLDVAGELLLSAGTNISLYNNTSTSAVDASGYVLPAIDA